jgi:small subunit ribosomal protein S1
VISIGEDAVFVDLGGKSEGVLALDQVRGPEGELLVKVGDRVEAVVVESSGGAGVVLRRTVARGSERQGELEQAFAHQIPVEGLVTAVIKGGFEVQVAGVRAFCPVSQIDAQFVELPDLFVGQRLTFRITRYDSERGRPNLVLSRRVLLEEEQAERAAELRTRLREGAVMRGIVVTIKDYGAFVDLGGITGMLHVSELGFSRVSHPSELLHVGQELEVAVTRIEKTGDPKRPEKISLSIKSLGRDPWEEVERLYSPGTRARGRVVRLQPFGAFVEIATGVEGLVHVSELGGREGGERVSPHLAVAVGQEVEVTVLNVDRAARRIALSIRAALQADLEAEERANIAEHAPREQSLGTLGDLLKDRLKR